jgi:hypothetical protein
MLLADHPISYFRLDEGPDNGSGNNGTYADISTATSPYSVPLTGSQRYFRVRVR